jgi:hypothetical protein
LSDHHDDAADDDDLDDHDDDAADDDDLDDHHDDGADDHDLDDHHDDGADDHDDAADDDHDDAADDDHDDAADDVDDLDDHHDDGAVDHHLGGIGRADHHDHRPDHGHAIWPHDHRHSQQTPASEHGQLEHPARGGRPASVGWRRTDALGSARRGGVSGSI